MIADVCLIMDYTSQLPSRVYHHDRGRYFVVVLHRDLVKLL